MRNIMLWCMTLFLSVSWGLAQESHTDRSGTVVFHASYIGENMNVTRGGIRSGSCYHGLANISVSLNTGHAGLWEGGELVINAANTHGGAPSKQYIGDYQVASNIEAGNHTYFQELFYCQELGPVTLTLGMQDLNIELVGTQNGALFLNSSFGMLPTLSGNLPVSVFPLTSPGITVKWTAGKAITWLNALYDGSPTDFEHNNYNLKWKFGRSDGVFMISEVQIAHHLSRRSGTIKTGIYMHHHGFSTAGKGETHDTTFTHKLGFYIVADQLLWQHAVVNKSLSAFVQIGLSPNDYLRNHYYLGFGMNYNGLFNRSGKDVLGLALAHVGLHGNARRESTIELTYQFPLYEEIFLQPDFQYIINPSGLSSALPDCLVVSVRFGFSF